MSEINLSLSKKEEEQMDLIANALIDLILTCPDKYLIKKPKSNNFKLHRQNKIVSDG